LNAATLTQQQAAVQGKRAKRNGASHMGFLSDMKAAINVQKIKNGVLAKLSISQIVCLIVNLPDAQRNLTAQQFQDIYAAYKELRRCKSKLTLSIEGYYDVASRIILLLDEIAPYEKYSG